MPAKSPVKTRTGLPGSAGLGVLGGEAQWLDCLQPAPPGVLGVERLLGAPLGVAVDASPEYQEEDQQIEGTLPDGCGEQRIRQVEVRPYRPPAMTLMTSVNPSAVKAEPRYVPGRLRSTDW